MLKNGKFFVDPREIDEFIKLRVGVGARNLGGLWELKSRGQKVLVVVMSCGL